MNDLITEAVKKKYAQAITERKGCCSGSGSGSSCCDTGISRATQMVTGNIYSEKEVQGLPEDMIATSFGCGNPTALAELHPGETVLDLGSGAGLDVLLSAKRVGPQGKAYGLDMTDEMLAEARKNREKSGVRNAEFLQGHIENIPLPDHSVDVIISNCVINLSGDKDKVMRECFRVLKPGGRFAVSDIVLKKSLPPKLQQDLTAWAGCIAGALSDAEYQNKLAAAGFENIDLQTTRVYEFAAADAKIFAQLSPDELANLEGAIASAFIRARKRKIQAVNGIDYHIRQAVADDLFAIEQLLAAAGLPIAGVEDNLAHFLLAVSPKKQILAVIGMEQSGSAGLLRSLAVDPGVQKQGIAAALIIAALSQAKSAEINELYLLTETAESYLQRFGFKKISRSEIPASLLNNSALASACSAGSACMKREIY